MHHPFIAPFIARRSPRVSSPLRRLIHATGPVYLAGLTFPDWIRLLRANHWQVHPQFLPRPLLVTLASAMTSVLKVVDDVTHSDTCDEKLWQRPVFILAFPGAGRPISFNSSPPPRRSHSLHALTHSIRMGFAPCIDWAFHACCRLSRVRNASWTT